MRNDYYDHHTVQSGVVLDENDLDPLKSTGKIEHVSNDSTAITYWGEVRCYAGTFNYPLIYEQGARKNLGKGEGVREGGEKKDVPSHPESKKVGRDFIAKAIPQKQIYKKILHENRTS